MISYMSEQEARSMIVEIGRRLYDLRFVAANDGNISIRISDDTLIVTPTGVSKGFMKESDLVKMKMDGTVLTHQKPSSEVKMHIAVYEEHPHLTAVVHAHPPISTAFAACHKPIDSAVLPEMIVTLGNVMVAPYALPGTNEVPDSIRPFIKKYNAVLLANHGLLTWGRNITEAFYRTEATEQVAKILLYIDQIGTPYEFSDKEIDDLINIRTELGIESGGRPNKRGK